MSNLQIPSANEPQFGCSETRQTLLQEKIWQQIWQQRSKPMGPYCEWPRWKGGDPAERWPS